MRAGEIAAFCSSDRIPQPLWAAVHYHYRRDGGNCTILAEDNFAHGNCHEFRCPLGQFLY